MRLIDADALETEIMEFIPFVGGESGFIRVEKVLELIESTPTIEAKPVVHAHWKDCEDPRNAFCTHCGLVIEKQTAPVYRYCRACGAQMDGKEK